MSRDRVGTVTHRFARGLRCNNQLRYVTVEARGMQMLAALPLPPSWPGSASGDESGRFCLLLPAVVAARTRAPGLAATVPMLTEPHAVAQWCAQSALQLAASAKPCRFRKSDPRLRQRWRSAESAESCYTPLQATAGHWWLGRKPTTPIAVFARFSCLIQAGQCPGARASTHASSWAALRRRLGSLSIGRSKGSSTACVLTRC